MVPEPHDRGGWWKHWLSSAGSVIGGRSRRPSWLALLLVVSLLGGVRAVSGERPANPGTPPGDRGMGIRLVDVAEQAGVTVLNITGELTKDYILEVNGNGAAFFDYDNDGYLDILIVNGSTLRNFEHGGDQMVILYRNEGNGTFTDVTAKAGLLKKGWGTTVSRTSTSRPSARMCYTGTTGTERSPT